MLAEPKEGCLSRGSCQPQVDPQQPPQPLLADGPCNRLLTRWKQGPRPPPRLPCLLLLTSWMRGHQAPQSFPEQPVDSVPGGERKEGRGRLRTSCEAFLRPSLNAEQRERRLQSSWGILSPTLSGIFHPISSPHLLHPSSPTGLVRRG